MLIVVHLQTMLAAAICRQVLLQYACVSIAPILTVTGCHLSLVVQELQLQG